MLASLTMCVTCNGGQNLQIDEDAPEEDVRRGLCSPPVAATGMTRSGSAGVNALKNRRNKGGKQKNASSHKKGERR